MRSKTEKLTLSAMFLALGMVLPLLTGQIPAIGKMLLPMHLPVFLCAFLCGWPYALPVGLILPLIRTVLFGKPAPYPDAIAIALELATYALVTALCDRVLRKKGLGGIYLSLLLAMIAGRLVRGGAQLGLLSLQGLPFGAEAFLGGIVLTGLPGILLQLILIPTIISLWKGKRKRLRHTEEVYMPDEVRDELAKTDWSVKDVLVGSTGSEGQLAQNLRDRFYYVPAKYLPSTGWSVRYVAVYQGSFYREPGVRYVAEVRSMRLVKRAEIPVPLRRSNGDEDYWLFDVEPWQTLERAIDVHGEAVTSPRLTNSFLLHHAEQVYQLFSVESEQDYLLLCALRQILHRMKEGHRQYEVTVDGRHTFIATGRTLRFCCQDEVLFRFRMEQAERDPRSMFVVLKNKMR